DPHSYTKLDDQGNDLPDSATYWATVQDNVTGLIWEIKWADDGVKDYSNSNDQDNTYTWYDPNPVTNGGNAGTPGDGTDTEDFINGLNAAVYGGFSDWRMPTIQELMTIVDRDRRSPAIDDFYFLSSSSNNYRSSTTYVYDASCAWYVKFSTGDTDNGRYINGIYKSGSSYVRAVRSGQ
ncbi:MAG: DUF1566 domain-containing protein, partial [Desulfococcaceae bacterium]|nr:DUF1566 domain-containing protein [Desulfococcaceae bacterium]